MKILSIITAWALATAGFSLDFDATDLKFTSAMGDNSADFYINISNKSAVTEDVISIEGGCSCLSFKPSKVSVAPGQSVKISGTFEFSTSSGKQKKIITVHSKTESPVDGKTDHDYRLILEGEILSPLKITKSALIWIDRGTKENKPFSIQIKDACDVVSVKCLVKKDEKNIFNVASPASSVKGDGEYTVGILDTDLKEHSPNYRDYFSAIDVTYIVKVGDVEKTRSERVSLLLAKDPKIKYGDDADNKR